MYVAEDALGRIPKWALLDGMSSEDQTECCRSWEEESSWFCRLNVRRVRAKDRNAWPDLGAPN